MFRRPRGRPRHLSRVREVLATVKHLPKSFLKEGLWSADRHLRYLFMSMSLASLGQREEGFLLLSQASAEVTRADLYFAVGRLLLCYTHKLPKQCFLLPGLLAQLTDKLPVAVKKTWVPQGIVWMLIFAVEALKTFVKK